MYRGLFRSHNDASCNTLEKPARHVEQFRQNVGIPLDAKRITKNPEQWSLSKLTQSGANPGNRPLTGRSKSLSILLISGSWWTVDVFHVWWVSDLHDDRARLRHPMNDHCELSSPNPNIFLACFTTCRSRLRLCEALDPITDRALYHNMDSIIFVERPRDPTPQPNLGDSSEISSTTTIKPSFFTPEPRIFIGT